MSRAAKDQPHPEKNDQPYIVDMVKLDLDARAAKGEETYGTKLQAFNGRDSLMDAYQEVLDLAVYLKQFMIEQGIE